MYSQTHWSLPSVRDLTRGGGLSTYDENVLKQSKVSFRGKCARMLRPQKLPLPTKLARLGHFPPVSQAGRLAGSVFYTICIFSLRIHTVCKRGGAWASDRQTPAVKYLYWSRLEAGVKGLVSLYIWSKFCTYYQ
jgi:hypothetical protein